MTWQHWLDGLWAATLNLGLLVVMFVPLERAFPARPGQPLFRHRFGLDLTFYAGQALGISALAVWLITHGWMQVAPLVPASLPRAFAEWPLAAKVVTVLLAGDFCVYWWHRAQHRFEWLWRMHAIHHGAERLDWLAAHREHPLDGLVTQAVVNLPALVLGFDLLEVAGLIAFRGGWGVFIHSNTRLPLGPLEYFVGSPALHHQHHACERDPGNYANLCPLMDLAFGTFNRPGHEPERIGVTPPLPPGYLGQLAAPFRPGRPG